MVSREERREKVCQWGEAWLSSELPESEVAAFLHLIFRVEEPLKSLSYKSLLLNLSGVEFLLLSVERVVPNNAWILLGLCQPLAFVVALVFA